MVKVVVPVKEEIMQAAERRKATGVGEDIATFLSELIDLGFEHRLQGLYQEFEDGEISFGYFARELGLNTRDLYAIMEERGLPTSNIGNSVSYASESSLKKDWLKVEEDEAWQDL